MITKKMTFREILEKKPEAARILFEYGMHCCGCHMAADETLEQGAKAHGMSDKDINELIKKLNSSSK